jgi:hypothetical protein
VDGAKRVAEGARTGAADITRQPSRGATQAYGRGDRMTDCGTDF